MRYEVPQFSEVQTKVVGPFTLRQFFYLAAGGLTAYLAYKFLKPAPALIIGGPAALIGAAFAFLKVQGMTMEQLMLKFMKFMLRPKFYTWKKQIPKEQKIEYKEENEE